MELLDMDEYVKRAKEEVKEKNTTTKKDYSGYSIYLGDKNLMNVIEYVLKKKYPMLSGKGGKKEALKQFFLSEFEKIQTELHKQTPATAVKK